MTNIFNLSQLYFQILEELTAVAVKNQQEDSSKGISNSLSGDSLEMAIRAILNPNSKYNGKRMRNGRTDVFLISKGILLEVKTGCATISYSGDVKDSLKGSNFLAYIPEILEDTILEEEVRVIPKKDFLEFLFSVPTLYRMNKKPTFAYNNPQYQDSTVISIQSFYSEGRKRSSKKSRRLLDNFLNQYPSFQEFCDSLK